MDLAAKLQLKPGQHLVGALVPPSASPDLSPILGAEDGAAGLIAFVVDRAALERQRPRIVASATKGNLTWVSYPKAGQLGTDLNRDTLAAALEESGIEPVRQIAIDDVWSALRFRAS